MINGLQVSGKCLVLYFHLLARRAKHFDVMLDTAVLHSISLTYGRTIGRTRMSSIVFVMMFVYSIALTIIQTATTTIIQEKVESSKLGRVFGLMGAMYSGFLPVGMAIFGPLADMLPLQWIMVGSGIALILVTVYLRAKSKLDLYRTETSVWLRDAFRCQNGAKKSCK